MDGQTHDMLRATNITMTSNQRSNLGLGSFRRQSVIDQSPERKFFKRRGDSELRPGHARDELRTSNNDRKRVGSLTVSPSKEFNKYVSKTPTVKPDALTKGSTMMSGLTQRNIEANTMAKKVLELGNFRIDRKERGKSINKMRLDPLQYRGPNIGDCLYHTMQSFKVGRNHMSPARTSLDWNIPISGGQNV